MRRAGDPSQRRQERMRGRFQAKVGCDLAALPASETKGLQNMLPCRAAGGIPRNGIFSPLTPLSGSRVSVSTRSGPPSRRSITGVRRDLSDI
ncbi:hypothetical protein AAFF_G00275100 [Aldrovandia affinis]|uniref:Uncharacterized protein n=1 Tax=Aldrovandia affinis TaxID=143900 RepID=A0AAD7WSR6_9TELE|nr:hypothetical protein AAFF_G00275100 [Aldrovandia affinis]